MPQYRRVSDLDERTKRLIQRKLDEGEGRITKRSRWLTPRTADLLLTAINAHKRTVSIDERMFSIKYVNHEKVWVRPIEGNTPCGYYTQKLLEGIISDTR